MKNKETIEEAAENNYPEGDVWTIEQALIRRLAFINGAKWQAERMYSEEEVEEIFKQAQLCAVKSDGVYFKYETFEQFKKK
jgi:hypothetical protein